MPGKAETRKELHAVGVRGNALWPFGQVILAAGRIIHPSLLPAKSL